MSQIKDCDTISKHVGILIGLLEYTLFVSPGDFMFLSCSTSLNKNVRVTKSTVMIPFFFDSHLLCIFVHVCMLVLFSVLASSDFNEILVGLSLH